MADLPPQPEELSAPPKDDWLVVPIDRKAAVYRGAHPREIVMTNGLMRLRELEVGEKVAAGGKLNVVLGEKGLAERVVNLL